MEDEPYTGDISGRDVASYGYIMSPHYPRHYDDDTAMNCTLTPQTSATVVITFLDFHLEHSTDCQYDWVEMLAFEQGDLADRSVHCGVVTPGLMTSLHGDEVVLRLRTDDSHTRRGFWIKYEGKRRLLIGFQ